MAVVTKLWKTVVLIVMLVAVMIETAMRVMIEI